MIPLLIAIIAVLVIGGGIYVYEQNKSQQPTANDQIVATSTNQTTNSVTNKTVAWKTYTDTKYGFSVRYPSDWTVTDTSSIVAINNTKNTAVNIESPIRYDLSGYQGAPVSYRILIYLDNQSNVLSVADFGSPDPKYGHESWWDISVPDSVRKATSEYATGQQIISSFMLVSTTQALNSTSTTATNK